MSRWGVVSKAGMLRVSEVATRLGVTETTVYQMMRSGRLSAVRVTAPAPSLRAAMLVPEESVARLEAVLAVRAKTDERPTRGPVVSVEGTLEPRTETL